MKRKVIQFFVILSLFTLLLLAVQVLRWGGPTGYLTYAPSIEGVDTEQRSFGEGGRTMIMGFSFIVLFISMLYITLKLFRARGK